MIDNIFQQQKIIPIKTLHQKLKEDKEKFSTIRAD